MNEVLTPTTVEALAKRLQAPLHVAHSKDVEGLLALPPGWTAQSPPEKSIATPKPIGLSTLTGLKDYLDGNVDAVEKAKLMLHVISPTSVVLIQALDDEDLEYRRKMYASATSQATEFQFGRWFEYDEFVVALLTQFQDLPLADAPEGYTGETPRALLLKFLGTITESVVQERDDDGVSQRVAVRQGITRKEQATVPSPLALRPFRTFIEVDQPEGLFVLRMRSSGEGESGKPEMSLYNADGGLWKVRAIQSVAAWLRTNCPEVKVVA